MSSFPSESAATILFAPGYSDAVLLHDRQVPPCLHHAVVDFVEDCRLGTGRTLTVLTTPPAARCAIIVGVAGQSALLAQIERVAGAVGLALAGLSESFRLVPIKRPLPGIEQGLLVIGSDANGAMYGLYELSERVLGTDPLRFWTDHVPEARDVVQWTEGAVEFGPPSFRYRGVFINDEDCLIGWRTPPEDRIIDDEVYARILETICRLKGNMVAPAMFARYMSPAIRQLAHERGLFYTASHLEILLSNPQNYWAEFSRQRWGQEYPYSYTMYPEKLREYWRDAIARHAQFRNVWPVGLKGITDFAFWFSDPHAPVDRAARAQVVNRALHDQLAMLRAHGEVVGTLTMREELLDLFNTGHIQVPANVILVWDDDGQNARMRQLPEPALQTREGGNGVYYHLAYCDNPWVQWVPLEVMRDEFRGIAARRATRYALFNVGNLREIPLTLRAAMNLVWDMQPWLEQDDTPRAFARRWAEQHFGRDAGPAVAALYAKYFNLEYPCRAGSVVEGLVSHTTAMELKLLAPPPYDYIWNPISALDWVASSGIPELLRWYAQTMRFGPFHPRLGSRLSTAYLAATAPEWDRLYAEAQALGSAVAPGRKALFRSNLLLHLESSRGVNHWANATLRAFSRCAAGDFAAAAVEFDLAASSMEAIFAARESVCQGKWFNWYRGEYFNVWATCPWALKPDWHARDSRALATVARELAHGTAENVPAVACADRRALIVDRGAAASAICIVAADLHQSAVEIRLYAVLFDVPSDAIVAITLNGVPLGPTRLHEKVYKEVVPQNPPSGIVTYVLDREIVRPGENRIEFAFHPDAPSEVRNYRVGGALIACYPRDLTPRSRATAAERALGEVAS